MINGKTIISDEVFVELAKTAMSKIENLGKNDTQKTSLASIAKLVADKVTPQIIVKKSDVLEISEDETDITHPFVSFELKITLLYGVNIPNTVNEVREAIKDEVEKISGYSVERVDITVEKLIRPQPIIVEDIEE